MVSINTNRIFIFVFVLVFVLLVLGSCKKDMEIAEVKLSNSEYLSTFLLDDYYSDNTILAQLTDSIYNSLTPKQRASQMIIAAAGKNAKTESEINNLLRKELIGGVLLLGKNKNIKTKLSNFNKLSELPLFYCIDAEPSFINRRIVRLKEKFVPAGKTKSLMQVQNTSYDIAAILSSLGITYNFAPVSDLKKNKAIIGYRSFGTKVKEVVKKTDIFILEQQSNGIIATSKHFPGHGYAKGDSHKKLVFIDKIGKEAEVFKSNIKAGVLSVMIGHLVVKNGKYKTDGLPSSISKIIVTDLLRKKLGFKGLIITDALNMKAVSQIKNVGFKAAMAGNDLILFPPNEAKLSNKIIKSLSNPNSKYHTQFKASIKRIIRMKICLGLF